MQELLRHLPKVDQLLEEPRILELLKTIPRALVLKAIRESLEAVRTRILSGVEGVDPTSVSKPALVDRVAVAATSLAQPSFRRVVNATGVIIHTNLGRSLMAEEAMAAIMTAGRQHSNLEFDLGAGRRGSRYSHVEGLLCDLTGAEAALVVNNNAAAVLITLQTLASGREAIVSRGELVEIGGSFRIPEVMARSGAILREVGATNKTHLRDYADAIGDDTALLMKVHQSNFRMIGFTSMVDVKDLAALGRDRGVSVMEDLGSGTLVDFTTFGLRREPTVRETVAAGVDVVTFSGDKLLGGPQAGVILGRRDIVDRIKKNPLNRALRIDKFTLAGLEATLRLYLDEDKAASAVPTLAMITAPYRQLRLRAARLKRKIAAAAGADLIVDQADGFSQIGGGAMPAEDLPTRLVTLRPLRMSVNDLEKRLRSRPMPIIGRIENDALVLDVRTLTDDEFDIIARALTEL